MKKLTIICTFILITVFSTGTFLIHLHYLKSYKKEFKTYLKQTKNVSARSIILINPSELYANSDRITWEDRNKEIIYEGVLYDILEIKSQGLKIALIAVSDAQEMILKKHFAELYDSGKHETSNNPFLLLKNFLSLKTTINSTGFSFKVYTTANLTIHTQGIFRIPVIFISEETPPPDFFT